jgi:pSer/pThr/pTyr-binding forkhead associated (FHA) protein
VDVYHTKVQLPCRGPDSTLAEKGYVGCAPDEIVATLTGASLTTKRRFCVNIYRDATRFIIGRLSATVLLDMRHYTPQRTVSHEHARISYQPEIKSFVLDNIGRNGTRVNGEVIRSGVARSFITLVHNDVITIGGVDMHFKLNQPPTQ